MATVGQVSNTDHENVKIGKAGRKRHLGFRPTVRGSVMNPCDPHTVVVKVNLQLVVQVLLHHGANLLLVTRHVLRNTVPINLS